MHLLAWVESAIVKRKTTPHQPTWIPQDIRTLLRISPSSGREWERVQTRSEQIVKEEAVGWIPKGYHPNFLLMEAKSFKTISTEQMHLSWWATSHVTYLHWTTWESFGERGEGMMGGEGWWCGHGGGSGIRGHCSTVLVCCSISHSGTVDVQMLAVLLWSMEYAEVPSFF